MPTLWLKDRRHRSVGQQLLQALVERPSHQLSHLASSRAQEVAFSRWLSNDRVHLDQLVHGITAHTSTRVQGHDHVLVASDTTEINLKHTDGYRQDDTLGVTGNNTDSGFFIHAGLALCADDGRLLGCASLQVWTRHGEYDFGRVESDKWFTVARHVADLAPVVTLVHDREGDVFDHWLQMHGYRSVCGQRQHLLTRARQDRRVWNARAGSCDKLYAVVRSAPMLGTFELDLPPRANGAVFRARRTSRMTVRACAVELVRPGETSRRPCTTRVQAIEVRELEADVPHHEQAVVWRLLTTHAVNTLDDALQVVRWYLWRWRAEDCFATIKSRALDLEASRLHRGSALLKLGVMSVWSATQLQRLVKGRDDAVTSASVVFDEAQLQCLETVLPRFEGKTAAQRNPHPQGSLAWAVWIIARLGYQHDNRPPGPTRLKRGLERFDALFLGWRAARETLP